MISYDAHLLSEIAFLHVDFFVTINWHHGDKVTSMFHEFILILHIWLLGFLDHLNEGKQLNAAVLGADIHLYGSFSSMWEILELNFQLQGAVWLIKIEF